MNRPRRIGRLRGQISPYKIIPESAYKNRGVFRTVCAATALGLAMASVISTAPQTLKSSVHVTMEKAHSAAVLRSEEFLIPASDDTLSPMANAQLEELGAFMDMIAEENERRERLKNGETPFASGVTRMSEAEIQQKLDEIQAEKDRIAEEEARIAEEEARRKAAEEAKARVTVSRNSSSGYVRLNTDGVPMSQKGSVAVDENGVPYSYSRLIVGKVTAYSGDPITSCGTVPVQGTVAVDPREIPYGTRMYIVSADGRYVYGYSVAEDTGGFIYWENGATVDLFMYSEADADQWGWRTAYIYILD